MYLLTLKDGEDSSVEPASGYYKLDLNFWSIAT